MIKIEYNFYTHVNSSTMHFLHVQKCIIQLYNVHLSVKNALFISSSKISSKTKGRLGHKKGSLFSDDKKTDESDHTANKTVSNKNQDAKSPIMEIIPQLSKNAATIYEPYSIIPITMQKHSHKDQFISNKVRTRISKTIF